MAVEIQVRRGAASVWTSVNPTLAQGEWGLETDTDNLKIGNGTSAWTSLAYQVYPYASVVNLISAASVATEAYAFSITNAASVSLAASIAAGGGGSGSVSSVFGRTGAVAAQVGDYSAYYDLNGKASAASTAAIAASDPAGLAASVKALSLLSANNLADVADAGTSRQDIHIPALTSVAAVQTASVGSFTGLPLVDGYQTANGDAILVTASGVNNGPWLVGSGSWTRPTEFATGASVHGRTVAVMNGTVGANQVWQLNTPTAGILVGTTTQSWALSGNAQTVFNVRTYGATGNGTTDDTAAINSALTAASVNGGIVYFPSGTYKTSSTITNHNPGVSFIGEGSAATTIQPTSALTGDTLVYQVSPVVYNQTKAGTVGGLTIDGSNTSAASVVGLHYGDTIAGNMNDLVIQNFNGTHGIGLHMDNRAFWTEETTTANCQVLYCTTCIEFDVNGGTGSFAYSNFDWIVRILAGQKGIVFKSGTPDTPNVFNSKFAVRGNFAGSVATFMTLNTGSGGALNQCDCAIQAEGDGVATGLVIGASDNIQNSFGFIDLGIGGSQSSDANRYSSFTGHFNCPGIGTFYAGGDPYFTTGGGPVTLGNQYTLDNHIWGGSGTPTTVFQFTTVSTGDFYFRSDTTGTALQRIYICTAGGMPGTWSGIL